MLDSERDRLPGRGVIQLHKQPPTTAAVPKMRLGGKYADPTYTNRC